MKKMKEKRITRIALIVMVMALLVGFSLPLMADDYPGTAVIIPVDPNGPEIDIDEIDWSKYFPEGFPDFDMITGTQNPGTDINTVISFGEKEKFVYDGNAKSPKINVADGLVKGEDYEILYARLVWDESSDIGISSVDVDSCVEAGYYLMVVYGIGDYRGSVKDGEYNQRIFVINQADYGVTLTLPESLDAVYGQTMKDIPLSGMSADKEGTFSWPDPDHPVGDAGNQQRVVVFTPEDRNYAAERKEVTLKVAPKELRIELIGTVEKVYDGTTAVPEDNGLGFMLDGIVLGDEIFADAASYQYASAEVGGHIPVTAAGITLSGEDAANYTVPDSVTAPVGTIFPIDTEEESWYYDGVYFCVTEGLMVGVGDGLFLPDGNSTRAQIVTMLWRLAGSPAADGEMPFNDAEDGAWYAEAVKWAAENDIVKGYPNGTFAPNQAITREEVSVFLYRMVQYWGANPYEAEIPASYTDKNEVSIWATEAMAWAIDADIINGMTETLLAPKETSTRAQLATMLYRFEISLIGEE